MEAFPVSFYFYFNFRKEVCSVHLAWQAGEGLVPALTPPANAMVGSFTVKGSVFLGGIKARGMQRETVWLSVTSGQLLISDTTTHRKLRQEKGQTNLALVSKVWVASLSTATFTPLKFLT